ncbi:MAG TPA: formyltransferase family protein [Candidatus Saccharimonadales bacterium]|nr:formyltransferase family protein [Candidatus Saccharimonadales bacterium]
MSELHNPKVAILASGSGSTAESYVQTIHNGQVQHEVGLVISSQPHVGILKRAERWNKELGFDVQTAVINSDTHPGGQQGRGQTREESEAIVELANENKIDLIATLGYMVIINNPLVEAYCYVPDKHKSMYDARTINTHPGPLPLTADTYGVKASATAIRAYRRRKITKSQHTVHVVADDIDAGPIVAAHDVPIKPEDTPEELNERTQWIEKATIAYALDKFLRDQKAYRADA